MGCQQHIGRSNHLVHQVANFQRIQAVVGDDESIFHHSKLKIRDAQVMQRSFALVCGFLRLLIFAFSWVSFEANKPVTRLYQIRILPVR